MRLTRTATLALALMIVPVALLRPAAEPVDAASDTSGAVPPAAERVVDVWLAALNDGALAQLDSIVADSVRVNGTLVSRQRVHGLVAEWRARAGGRRALATPFVTDGEMVGLWTWSEFPGATGRAAGDPADPDVKWLGADFLRVEDGRIVEGWLAGGRLR